MKYLLDKTILLLIFVLSASIVVFAQMERKQGIELYKKDNFQSAVKILRQAVKSNDADAQAWFFLGLSYLKQDKKKDSEKALEKAVALDGKNAKIRIGLAYIYLLRNSSLKAQKEAQTALELDPHEEESYYILGVVDARNGQYDAAYEKASQAVKMSPNFAAAYLLKSESLISSLSFQPGTPFKTPEAKKILFKNATESLEKYVSLSPDGKDVKFQRQYLESLKFFSEYYSSPENQIPVTPDIDKLPTDANKTPIKFIEKPRAAYTDKARESSVEGTIRLLVGFAADGKVRHVLIIKSLGYGLNEEAVRAAFGIKFVPATKDGKPISTVAIVEYNFNIY